MFSGEKAEMWKRWLEFIVPLIPALIAMIITFAIEICLTNKKIIGWKREKGIKKAKALGQVVEGRLDSKKRVLDRDGNGAAARYVYSIDGIHNKQKVIWKEEGHFVEFPDKIKIYYLGHKVYTDYDPPSVSSCLFPLLPFLVGGLVLYLTNPDMFNK